MRFRRTSSWLALVATAAQACSGYDTGNGNDTPRASTRASALSAGDLDRLELPFAPGGPATLLVEDFDRDGHADVAMLPLAGPGDIALARDGVLVPAGAALAGMTQTRRALAVDLDRDGDLDLFSACAPCAAGGQPVLAMGEWAQSGAVRFEPQSITAPADAGVPVAYDVDADGNLDVLLFSVDGTGDGMWLRNDGAAFAAGSTALPTLGAVTGATAIDVDQGGLLELYVARPGVDALLVRQPDGSLKDEGAARGLTATGDEVGVARGDLDADGVEDVIRVAPDGTLTAVLVRPGGALVEQALGALGPTDPTGIALVDLDGDALAEIIVPSASGPGAVLGFIGHPGTPKFAATADATPGASAGAPSAHGFRPGRAAYAAPAASGASTLIVTRSRARDCDAEPERPDLAARRDLDGDGPSTEDDVCPRVVDRRQLDHDGDRRGDYCDPEIWGPGTPGLRAVQVLEHGGTGDLAAEAVNARDLSRVHADLQGRLPTGESFLLFTGPPPHREAVDASGYVQGDELIELYSDRTGDHAYVTSTQGFVLEQEGGYRRLRTLGWVSATPVDRLGKPRELYRLAILRPGRDGQPVREEGITADEQFRDQLLAEGYWLEGTLGWVLRDEGRLRKSGPVVRYHRADEPGLELHSSAIAAEPDLTDHVSDDVAFRLYPEATRYTRPLYRLRGGGGRQLLVSDPGERAQLLATGWRRDTMLGHLIPAGRAVDTLDELVPLFRFEPAGAPAIHTADARTIADLAAQGVPATLLGFVVPQPAARDASCPATRAPLADRLRQIDDDGDRAKATLLGLVTACELKRAARGDRANAAEWEMAAMLAERADPFILARVEETLAPWHALDATMRAELLGPLAEYDPGDCSNPPDLEGMGEGLRTLEHIVPRTGVSLRMPMCQGVAYAGADPDGRAARAVVTTDRVTTIDGEFTTTRDFVPKIYGVQDTENVRGHARLEQYAAAHPDVGLPVTGVGTDVKCNGSILPCDETQGLRCVNGECVAYPVVKNGTDLGLVGVNFWDTMGAEVRLRRVGTGTWYQPADVSISHSEDLAGDDLRCKSDPVMDANGTPGFVPPGGTPPPWAPPSTLPEEAALNRALVDDFRPGAGAFYEVQLVNRNGHYFKHGELIPIDPKERERLGRTVHVCWSPGHAPAAALGTVACTPPTQAAACGVPGGDGPACGAANGGQFAGVPRPLSACVDPANAVADDGLCGETPLTFKSELGAALIYVEDTPPESNIEIALEGVVCHEETGPDWPGDDEYYMLMFGTPGRIPEMPSWKDVVETEMWAGDFDSGSRWTASGGPGRGELKTRLRVGAPGTPGDTAGVLMMLAEDDDYITEAIIGTVIIAGASIAIAFIAPSVLTVVGGAAAVEGAWLGFLNLLPDPDDHLGSAGWFFRKDDVTERGNETHDGVLGFVKPLARVAGGFSHNEQDSVVSQSPVVDFWGAWSNADLRVCSAGCNPGETCYQGVCVGADWDDSSWVAAPGSPGFLESRRFIEDPGDPDWDYELMLRYVATPVAP